MASYKLWVSKALACIGIFVTVLSAIEVVAFWWIIATTGAVWCEYPVTFIPVAAVSNFLTLLWEISTAPSDIALIISSPSVFSTKKLAPLVCTIKSPVPKSSI